MRRSLYWGWLYGWECVINFIIHSNVETTIREVVPKILDVDNNQAVF